MKVRILFWVYPLLVVSIMFYLLLHNQETAASLVLIVGGFMIPIMVFLSHWIRPNKNEVHNKSKNKNWLFWLFTFAIISTVALFLIGQKDGAIILAFVLLIIQRAARVYL